MPTKYPSLTIGAKARLAMFKREANKPNWVRLMTWRDVRFAKLTSSVGLSRGRESWYSMDNAECFRREKYASDVISLRYTGWYTDVYDNETARGIIVLLPHGRIIAGYEWSANGEKVYFPTIYSEEGDAAHAADGHAESFAESSREESEKYQAARDLESEIEDSLIRLRECVVLRHRKCMGYVREEIADLIESIRDKRETLATDFKDYL
jgi:hypothetical protein